MNRAAPAQESSTYEPKAHVQLLNVPFQHIAGTNAEFIPDSLRDGGLSLAGNRGLGHF
jgi:hypothetical protein